ncbi:MAG: UDP-N-acetylglucosamine--N-acetylmuramyl-(pentapeptide) pyrophosphoryl-undecaprenol N-acetylglucosamine transferase [Candidatus Kaiserbacteria bacterium]|nr:UDP-N-acetylglucosamine--N-acetylmuramyl-(pentapeptide) pyrophosphoryl-undecaprenol N-acetylglucosamine transferase [Candidatus Kaiserbacteria bacterium]
MKIVFVGGGTGGHFYPLIAVAEEIERYAREHQLVQPKKYYLGPKHYDEKALYDAGVKFVYCPAGKLRRTKDIVSRIKNFFSLFSIFFGALKAVFTLFVIFPDVVFSKGGYTSFPVLFAARLLRVPVVIHDSDSTLGRVSRWSASFAMHIAISYPEAENDLTEKQQEKAALIGIPLRRQLRYNPNPEAYTLLKLDPDIKTVAVLGGSSGAEFLNENVLDALPIMLQKYQVVHQVGKKLFDDVKKESESFLRTLSDLYAYHPFPFLNAYYMRALYSVADVIITRAGSGTLYEIAEWGVPAIVVPIREEVSHDQKRNAYAYARSAGGIVVEEQNLSPHLLVSQVDTILRDEKMSSAMRQKAKAFSSPKASEKVAKLLVDILKSHETYSS